MHCEKTKELMTQYLLGDLDEATSAEVRAHVEKCGGCQAFMQEIEPTLDLLRDALAAPCSAPRKLSDEQRVHIVNKAVNRQNKVIYWLTVSHPVLARAAALLMIAFIFGGLLLPSFTTSRQYARRSAAKTAAAISPESAEYGSYPESKTEELKPAEIQQGNSGAGYDSTTVTYSHRSYGGSARVVTGKGGAGSVPAKPSAPPAASADPFASAPEIPAPPAAEVPADPFAAPESGLRELKEELRPEPTSPAKKADPNADKRRYGKYGKPEEKGQLTEARDQRAEGNTLTAEPSKQVDSENVSGYVNLNDMIKRPKPAFIGTPSNMKNVNLDPAELDAIHVAKQDRGKASAAKAGAEAPAAGGAMIVGGVVEKSSGQRGRKHTEATPAAKGGEGEKGMLDQSGKETKFEALGELSTENKDVIGDLVKQSTDHKEQDGRSNVGRQGMVDGKTATGNGTAGKLLGGAQIQLHDEADTKATGGGKVAWGWKDSDGTAAGRADSTAQGPSEGIKAIMESTSGAKTKASLIEAEKEELLKQNDDLQAQKQELDIEVAQMKKKVKELQSVSAAGAAGGAGDGKEETVSEKYKRLGNDYYKDANGPVGAAAFSVPAPAGQQAGFVAGLPAKDNIPATGRLFSEKKEEKSGERTLAGKGFSGSTTVDVDLSGVGSGVGGDTGTSVVPFAKVLTKSPVILKGLSGKQAKEADKSRSAESHEDVEIGVAASGKKEKAEESKGEGKRGSQLSKLDSIVVPEMDFRQANLSDVVEFLKSSSVQFDKTGDESKGVNIVLQLPPGNAAPAAEGGQQAGNELVTFSARGLTVKQALKIVADYSGLKVKEEDNVIKLVPKDAPEDEKVLQSKKELEDKKEQEDKIAAKFKAVGVNPFVYTAQNPFSTFGIDCDTASYTVTRNYMSKGFLPPAEAVRTEEFVNFFDYAYKAPEQDTFKVYAEVAPSKFGRGGLQMIKIGVKGRRLGREEQRRAVLTFLVDTSGSMETADRIGLAKKALRMLVEKLNPQDVVSIVKYDSHAKLVIENVSASEKKKILDAIDNLQCSGSTNLEEGMEKAYAIAARNFVSKGENRVLLMSDGVANLGDMAAGEILGKVEKYRKQGIFCSVFGLGIGSYNDEMLQDLAAKGDGTYKFIDSEKEAKQVFVDDLSATLNTIAKDVKIQVEFNEKRVNRYRQIGYESRQLKKEDFRNDKIDAGEVGSGQSVTALYEAQVGSQKPEARSQRPEKDVIATVRVRYQRVDNGKVEEIERSITSADMVDSFDKADVRFKLAACAAQFAEILRGSPYAEGREYQDVARVLTPVAMELELDGRVQELKKLVNGAGGLSRGE